MGLWHYAQTFYKRGRFPLVTVGRAGTRTNHFQIVLMVLGVCVSFPPSLLSCVPREAFPQLLRSFCVVIYSLTS